MSTISITLSDEQLIKLREIASRFQLTTEELVRISIEDLLSHPEEEFREALKYVVQKNAELYRRLA